MKRLKRLYALLGVLVAVSIIAVAVSKYEEHKEEIRSAGEVVLEIDPDSVTSLAWENETTSLAFHKDETWLYDDDEAFPVSEDTIAEYLSTFEAMSASFIIENAEDVGQYGLDDPVCTITVGTADTTYTITLGDFSTLDEERYVSTGDGNVYLVATDPYDVFDAELSEVIENDAAPSFDEVSAIAVAGVDDYTVTYTEDGGSYRDEDVYFADSLAMDTSKVDSYLSSVSALDLTTYVTYNVTDDELADFGLDSPELTLSVDYTSVNEDGDDETGTFVLSVSRDPDELAAVAEADETDEEEEITAFARVGESQIVYQITGDEYEALMAASRDDLRHAEIFPAGFADVSQLEITLEDETYTITADASGDETVYTLGEDEIDAADLQSAVEALEADSFTSESATGKLEIAFTATLALDGDPAVTVELYRYDGESCLAVVDGEPLALVPRAEAVDLVEAVNAIVLN